MIPSKAGVPVLPEGTGREAGAGAPGVGGFVVASHGDLPASSQEIAIGDPGAVVGVNAHGGQVYRGARLACGPERNFGELF